MQVARLLEPRPRTLSSKIIEMFRAIQLEQRFSKEEILSIYMTLAPFGGNREGIRAASRTYFNREPKDMTAGEAALMVALPQSPSRLRPDHFPKRAIQSRNKVLLRLKESDIIAGNMIDRALKEQISKRSYNLPIKAAHLADRLSSDNSNPIQHTWIDADLQKWSEAYVRHYVKDLPMETSAAVMVVDNQSRQVLSYVGSAHYDDQVDGGYVDMVRAIRSPGSTLKPFIYGMAFDQNIARPNSRMNDVPTAFGDYKPKNFQDEHYGDISLSHALQLSLNVPAVVALERVGAGRFLAKMRRHGMTFTLPESQGGPGLAIALGGLGTTLESLVRGYAALADEGQIRELIYSKTPAENTPQQPAFINDIGRWYLADILRGVKAPSGLLAENYHKKSRNISYKTGTSYGFRDAWAIGYTREHTVGVWIGKADGTPNPGLFGANTAAPVLFSLFDRLGPSTPAHNARPQNLPQHRLADLSPALQRFGRLQNRKEWVQNSPPPEIIFPINDSLVEISEINNALVFQANGGKRPYQWVINGTPMKVNRWSKNIHWQAEGPGFNEVTVIDALGRRSSSYFQTQ